MLAATIEKNSWGAPMTEGWIAKQKQNTLKAQEYQETQTYVYKMQTKQQTN